MGFRFSFLRGQLLKVERRVGGERERKERVGTERGGEREERMGGGGRERQREREREKNGWG